MTTHADSSCEGRVFPSACLYVFLLFHMIPKKPMQLITKLDIEMFHDKSCKVEIYLLWGQRIKGHKSQKHCRCGSLHSCECRLLPVMLEQIFYKNDTDYITTTTNYLQFLFNNPSFLESYQVGTGPKKRITMLKHWRNKQECNM